MDPIGSNHQSPGRKYGDKEFAPSNIDFLSIPESSLLDYGYEEIQFLYVLNNVYGMLAAFSYDLHPFDPVVAFDKVNSALNRFWKFHHSDPSIPSWTLNQTWTIAHRYWA